MKRIFSLSVLLLVLIAIAAGGGWWWAINGRVRLPETPALLTQVREAMRLETLEVSLHKKVDFRPERMPAETAWKEVVAWIGEKLRNPRGRAIVFATAHLGYDLSKLDANSIRADGSRIELTLPPVDVRVLISNSETEIINSNLDSKETSDLLEHARKAFVLQVEKDPRLRARARRSAEQALKALLFPLGFREVKVTDAVAPAGAG